MEKIIEEGLELEATEKVEEKTLSNATAVEGGTGEDLLLAEIDAFRNKASQLQQLIVAKEEKAAELEELVREKESANKKLQDELKRRQEEADKLVSDVETQVDRMMQVVKTNMDQLGVDIKDQVNNNQESYESQNKTLQDTLSTVSDGLGNIQNELSEKTHSESVHLYRLIQDLLKEHDNTSELLKQAQDNYNSLKSRCLLLTILSIISIGVSVASLLSLLGIL